MDFEELHGKIGAGTNVGVDLTTLMTSLVAVSTTGENGGAGGSGGSDMTAPRIASFQAYWDVQGKQFKVFSPKVVDPSGNEIAVTEAVLSRGTYVCEVKKSKATGVYTAAIKLIDAIVPSAETVTVVKLFKIEDGKVEQYHVGAIILGGKEGDEDGAPLPWDVREYPGVRGLYQVYSPIAVVMVPENGKKPLKIVATNAREGEWNTTTVSTIDGVKGIYCVITATPSSSGEISYECQMDAPFAKAAILSVLMATVTEVQEEDPETGDIVTKNVFHQVRRGAPSVVGLGMPDRVSISLNDDRMTEIKGFSSQADEDDKLAELLSRGDSEDEYAGSVLVRTTDEDTGKHSLVFVPVGKGIGGGGGGTAGYSGTLQVPTGEIRCNSDSGYYIQSAYYVWTFDHGLLKSVGTEKKWTTGIPTTPLSEEL